MASSAARGPIAWMARNAVAANLLMFVIVVGGVMGLLQVKQEVFPEFDLDQVTVTVPYPGASPSEVEQGIVLAVEEAARAIDGVKRVSASAAEGQAMVGVELQLDADPNEVLADVKSAVDRIRTFPEEAEEPQISLATRRNQVISLVVAGDTDLRSLHEIAEQARAELQALPEVTVVELQGVPPLEVAIEVPRQALESLDLSLEEVARMVAAGSLELPGGSVKTRAGEIMVRVADRRLRGHQFADLRIRSSHSGAEVRLGQIATIRDGYEDTDEASWYGGKRAVRLTVFRVGEETPAQVSQAVRAYREQLRAQLPPELLVEVWDDDSEKLSDRMRLLTKNGAMGLALVVLILTLFLRLRLAFWVSLGLPISFFGAFFLMPGADLSLNMISLFAFIVTLGMVVDDAIVVGENIYAHMQRGEGRLQAAIQGAREMAMPVSFAILTSIAAFLPLFFVPGTMGKIFSFFPFVVTAVLAFSLLESFFVLPAHLAHSSGGALRNPVAAWVERQSDRAGAFLERFTQRRYRPALEAVLRHRYLAIATAAAVFMAALGLALGGVVPFNFFPKMEGDLVSVSVRMPYGTPVARTEEAKQLVEAGAWAALRQLGQPEASRGMFSSIGTGQSSHYAPPEKGSHLLEIELALVPTDDRPFSAEQFASAWAENVPELPGAESVLFNSSVGPGAGAAVDLQLSHTDTAMLERAAAETAEQLAGYVELFNVENGFSAGKPQLDFHLRPEARSLGLSANELARQLRAAFYGAEALREQRGRNELKVMVRLPEAQRRSEHDLESLQVRTPAGGFVPLSYVASFDRGHAPTDIQREDGRRIVNVRADLTAQAKSSRGVVQDLEDEFLPQLRLRHTGLEVELAGQQRAQNEAFGSLGRNYLVALFVIYALLAIPFRSYAQPLIIMSVIPFGFVGALGGHILMGYSLSLISLFGIVALSGVVVNDSLVLIDAVNKLRAGGLTASEAAVRGGMRRLRPIMLTSLTTFFGLVPIIFEPSVQARFLIPMAISLGFGVLFATLIVLLIVPALYLVLEDLLGLGRRAAPSGESG